MKSDTPWKVQQLSGSFNGYSDWATFAVRDSHNHCLATVGSVDRATAPHNESNAHLMASAPELLKACRQLYSVVESLAFTAKGLLPNPDLKPWDANDRTHAATIADYLATAHNKLATAEALANPHE